MNCTIYVDSTGALLGTYWGAHSPPDGGIAVDTAPDDSRQRWNGSKWEWPDSSRLLVENNEAYTKAVLAFTPDYPELEKDTWPIQKAEAQAWQQNQDVSTPWVDIAAAAREMDRVEFLNRIVVKLELFKAASAHLTGLRQKYEDQIKRGETPVFEYALPEENASIPKTV